MSETEQGRKFWATSLREHLSELKYRIKIIGIAMAGSLVFWLLIPSEAFDPSALFTGLYRPMITIVFEQAKNLANGKLTLIQGTLTAPLEVYFLGGIVMSLITSSPVIGYEIYKFIDPALYPNEKRAVYRFTAGFVALFTVGAAIGWFVLTPAIIRFMIFFAGIVQAEPIINVGDFYALVFTIVGASAISFTTPVIFLLLVSLGIISTTALTKNRLIVYLALYVIIAALTPEPVVGHFGMFFPIVIMLEVSALIGRRIEKNRAIREGKPWPPPEEVIEKCKYCKAELDLTKSFCPNCGRSRV
jgi:sec-independent protein translocase protein TatC